MSFNDTLTKQTEKLNQEKEKINQLSKRSRRPCNCKNKSEKSKFYGTKK